MHLCTAPVGAFGVTSILDDFCQAALFAGTVVWSVGHDVLRESGKVIRGDNGPGFVELGS